VHILRKISPSLLLLLYKGFESSHIGIEDGSELLAANHFDKGLLVGVGHLRWFLQVLEILALTLQVVFQVFHIFQRGDAFQQTRWLQMLPRLVKVETD